MDIRFISSLTDNDEERFAPVLLKAMTDLLSEIPIKYLVRVETTRGKIFEERDAEPPLSPST